MDDFVLNVRQIAQYPSGQASPFDTVLFQTGGVGGPYGSTSIQDLVAAGGGVLAPSALPSGSWPFQLYSGVVSTLLEGAIAFNAYWDATPLPRYREAGPASVIYQDPASGSLNFDFSPVGQPNALTAFVGRLQLLADGTLAAQKVTITDEPARATDAVTVGWINSSAVRSVNGHLGAVQLNRNDIILSGGVAAFNGEMKGQPIAPTADGSCKHQVANVECVEMRVASWINGLINEHPFVFTFNDRRGDVWLTADDITEAGFRDPSNPPGAPTAPDGTATDQIANTAFVTNALADLQDWVEQELATSGDVTIAYLEANYAPLDSATLTGFPSAPTAPVGTSTGQLATTAFVMTAVTESTTGVASFNTRTGAVVLTEQDLTDAGASTLDSPAFTGAPTAPTPPPTDSSGRLANTQWVQNNFVQSVNGRNGQVVLNVADLGSMGGAPLNSPALVGAPTCPTANPGTATQVLANCAFVAAAVAAVAGVVTFNGRAGAVTLQSNDVSAAGGALLASPTFTGLPTAPTPPTADSTTRIATTAFVQSLIAGAGGVTSFNGRGGNVTLTAADVTAVVTIPGPATSAPLMNGAAAIGTSLLYARQDHVHPTDTSLATVAQLANYLPLNGTQAMQGRLTLANSAQCLVSPGFGNFFTSAQHSFQPANANICIGSYSAIGGGGNIAARVDNTGTYLVGFSYNGTFTGSITTNGTSTNYGTSSDERLKQNIRLLSDDLDSGDIIDRLQVRAFEWRRRVPGRRQETEYGFVAQELYEVVEQAVMPGDDSVEENEMGGRPWQSDNSKLVPFLVAEMQAVRRRLEALEA